MLYMAKILKKLITELQINLKTLSANNMKINTWK